MLVHSIKLCPYKNLIFSTYFKEKSFQRKYETKMIDINLNLIY